jgi:hypothetical protein
MSVAGVLPAVSTSDPSIAEQNKIDVIVNPCEALFWAMVVMFMGPRCAFRSTHVGMI